jgi:hypothetical protein
MIGATFKKPFVPTTTEDLFELSQKQDVAYVKVEPAIAQLLLDIHNKKNRPMSMATIKKYTHEMNQGMWRDGVTTIQFSSEQNLLDGQHRLAAVRDSGKPAIFSFTFNHDPASFAVIDTGKKRSGADTLSVHGFSNTSTLTSMIRKYNHYYAKQGNMWSINTPCSNEQILNLADSNEHFSRIAAYMDSHKNFQDYGTKSDLGASYAILHDIDAVRAEAFIEMALLKNQFVYDGVDFAELFSSLRYSLVRNKSSNKSKQGQGKKDPHEAESRTYWLMFDAWNAFVAGENREITTKKINRNRFVFIQKWAAPANSAA